MFRWGRGSYTTCIIFIKKFLYDLKENYEQKKRGNSQIIFLYSLNLGIFLQIISREVDSTNPCQLYLTLKLLSFFSFGRFFEWESELLDR